MTSQNGVAAYSSHDPSIGARNKKICNYLEVHDSPKRHQPSSSYLGVPKKSGKWAARIRICGVSLWLGTFHSEVEAHEVYQAASLHYREEEKKQLGQSCQNVAGPDNRAMTQKCKFCQGANLRCKYYEKVAATIVQAKKGKAKVGTVRGKAKKVHTKKTKKDMKFEADKSSDIPAAPVRVGAASSVHDDSSAKPQGFLEDLTAQLLKVLEATPEAGLEEDLIQLDEPPHWTKNLDCCDF